MSGDRKPPASLSEALEQIAREARATDETLFAYATKREVYAVMAMQGYITLGAEDVWKDPAKCAASAVENADALIAELAKTKEG